MAIKGDCCGYNDTDKVDQRSLLKIIGSVQC